MEWIVLIEVMRERALMTSREEPSLQLPKTESSKIAEQKGCLYFNNFSQHASSAPVLVWGPGLGFRASALKPPPSQTSLYYIRELMDEVGNPESLWKLWVGGCYVHGTDWSIDDDGDAPDD